MRNRRNIEALAIAAGNRYRFIGLSISNSEPGVDSDNGYRPGFNTYTQPTATVLNNFKLWATPQTLVISEDGTILKRWQGAFSSDSKKEIDDFFLSAYPKSGGDRID